MYLKKKKRETDLLTSKLVKREGATHRNLPSDDSLPQMATMAKAGAERTQKLQLGVPPGYMGVFHFRRYTTRELS